MYFLIFLQFNYSAPENFCLRFASVFSKDAGDLTQKSKENGNIFEKMLTGKSDMSS
jgi:hypothetical protein